MGLFDFLKKPETAQVDFMSENKDARVATLEDAEMRVKALADERRAEKKELAILIHDTEQEIAREEDAASAAIKAKDYKSYKAHVSKRKAAEETLTGYQLRLENISSTSVLPKEDIVALVRSLDDLQTQEVADTYKKARLLIQQLSDLDNDHAIWVNRLHHIITVLNRDIMNDAELYFKDEKGNRHYLNLMLGGFSKKGFALRILMNAMKRQSDAWAAITKDPTFHRDAFMRLY